MRAENLKTSHLAVGNFELFIDNKHKLFHNIFAMLTS